MWSHGNFKFCEYYAVKQENYYDLIYDALNIDNFTKGLEVITKYYHHILKLKDNQFELHSNTLSEVLEKWGEDIFRARSKEFTGFIEEIFKTNGLKLFSESFFRKSLSFLNKRYDNEFIKPFLNYLVS